MKQADPRRQPFAETRPTSGKEIDAALQELSDNRRNWARLPPAGKAAILRECIPRLVEAAPAWVADAAIARGLSMELIAEEWLGALVPTVRLARLLTESLEEIASSGRPALGTSHRRQGDQLRIDALPSSRIDRVLFAGTSGYVLLEPGLDADDARAGQASFYQQRAPEGAVCTILGAGNVASIPPMDAFTKLFVEGQVCLLKLNPVNDWVGPHLEHALAPLVRRGILRFVYGGADAGAHTVEHPLVDEIHITGSDRTHDHIVWGDPESSDTRARRQAGRPLMSKRITSELGNVSPVAIVPGDYSDDELWFQARNVVTMVTNNASFNCNAAKLLITSVRWHQRDRFFELLARGFERVPPRVAYYPGARDRYEALIADRPGVATYGDGSPDRLPWALIRNVDATRADDPLFRTEPFCGLLSETTLGSEDPVEFLAAATDFMNERLWGTLNACLIVPGVFSRDASLNNVLERAIRELRYGTVSINHWPAVAYASGVLPWGGHPSADLHNIQSGIGWVHNSYMLEGVEKSVLVGPLRQWPHPPWFYDHPSPTRVARRIFELEAAPRWRKLPGLLWRAAGLG